MCILGLVFILVGEEFNGGTFADCGVFDPITGACIVPLGGSCYVGGEVVLLTTFDCGVDFS